MTFSQFLTSPQQKTPSSFLHLAHRDPLWPAHSNRLEDFESFLLARLEEESEEVISELRDIWREYARVEPAGKHDQDLALAAWADYARHLRTCIGGGLSPCAVAGELLDKALDESSFEDLHHPMREATPCDGAEEGGEEDETNNDDLDEDDDGEWSESPLDDDDDVPVNH